MSYETFAIEAVRKAGGMVLALRQEHFETGIKGGNPRDIVTTVDTAVGSFLVEEIKKAFPDHGIHSEEGGGVAAASGYQWMIDPIDGSSNFSRGIPHFAICLGVVKDGVPEAAAVLNPVTNELFSFTKGEGARLNGKPIGVSSVRELSKAQALLSFGSRKPELWDWAAASYRKSLEHMLKRGTYNSSSLDICFIAAGRADVGVYGTLTTLDVAPAFGILYEAGGVACDESGQPVIFSPHSQKVFMANSPALLEDLRRLIEG